MLSLMSAQHDPTPGPAVGAPVETAGWEGKNWHRTKAIFLEAVELSEFERDAFVSRACAGDMRLRDEINSLLLSEEAAKSFLETAAAGVIEAEQVIQSPTIKRLEPGTVLGEYEITRFHSAGGMGAVYHARHRLLGRAVAIKTVNTGMAGRRRLIREARHASSLSHPNICTIYEVGEADGIPFIAMEFVDGPTLREIIQTAFPTLGRSVDYGIQISDALQHAHEHGIVHRDLKSSNVVVNAAGRPVMLDFGLAKRFDESGASHHADSTMTGADRLAGTLTHMAPEVLLGSIADARSDVWSLGVLLYELVTGELPFSGATQFETSRGILSEPLRPIGGSTPLAVRLVIERCLVKNPAERYQRAAEVRDALKAIRQRRGWPLAARLLFSSRRRGLYAAGGALLLVIGLVLGGSRLRDRLATPSGSGALATVGQNQWVQLTRLTEPVSQPAFSSDGRMLTFVRGPDTFLNVGEIFVKMLPDGEAVQLTNDGSRKMSPVFSPDNSQIAYTTGNGSSDWSTWIVPISGGKPHLWLPNASGLVWSDRQRILFSEIKNGDLHMALVAAEESRAGARDVYVPAGDRDMVHRSYASPDGKWAIAVEMVRSAWKPCRVVSMDGNSPGRPVGPLGAGCTSAAWSPDGKWMYLSSAAGGAFHIWRQRFPDGRPEQVTAGPTEEEGIAMAPNGRSFVTAVGLLQSAMWVHDSRGERQVSVEGYGYDPEFTPDGRKLLYRILKGALVRADSSELRVLDVESGRNESLLPGVAVIGLPGRAYNISADGQLVVVATLDGEGRRRLWLAPLDRRSAPSVIPNVEGDMPYFGSSGEIFFRAIEGTAAFAYRVHQDGKGLRKAIEQPIAAINGISRDGQWLMAKFPGAAGPRIMAVPLNGGSPVPITSGDASTGHLRWSVDGRSMFISILSASMTSGHTYSVPLQSGQMFPPMPAGGFPSEAAIAKRTGGRLIGGPDVAPGPTPGVYAFSRQTVQRNLYRIPIP